MKVEGRAGTRSYRSDLRSAQAAATRQRIVQAAVEILAHSPAELSVPAVAERAGVSVPTVYRHFESKKAVVDAVYDRYTRDIDVAWDDDPPASLDDLASRVPGVFARMDRVDPALRSVMSGPAGWRARRERMPERLARVEDVIAEAGAALSAADRERLRDVVLVLGTSMVQRAFREYLDLDSEAAADRVAWAIRRLAGGHEKAVAERRRRKTSDD